MISSQHKAPGRELFYCADIGWLLRECALVPPNYRSHRHVLARADAELLASKARGYTVIEGCFKPVLIGKIADNLDQIMQLGGTIGLHIAKEGIGR